MRTASSVQIFFNSHAIKFESSCAHCWPFVCVLAAFSTRFQLWPKYEIYLPVYFWINCAAYHNLARSPSLRDAAEQIPKETNLFNKPPNEWMARRWTESGMPIRTRIRCGSILENQKVWFSLCLPMIFQRCRNWNTNNRVGVNDARVHLPPNSIAHMAHRQMKLKRTKN